jgi:hypothetical protein
MLIRSLTTAVLAILASPLMAQVTRNIDSFLTPELTRACLTNRNQPVPNCTPNKPMRVYVNDQLVATNLPPILIDGRTWIEAAPVLRAMGYSVDWDGVATRVSAQKGDFLLQLTMDNNTAIRFGQYQCLQPVNAASAAACTSIGGYRAPDAALPNGLKPFISATADLNSTMRNRTLLPLAAIGDLVGAESTWLETATERRVNVRVFTPYFYDRKPDGSGADILFTDQRYVGPGGSTACAAGAKFDWSLRYCVDGTGRALGSFPANYRARAQALGFAASASDAWPTNHLLQVIDSVGLTGRSTADVVAEMQSHLEIFGLPFDNHDIASPGMFSLTGGNLKDFTRSEAVLPPFVMSGRRQTDQMVRTLYAMLPQNLRDSTAFVLPDRLAQNPEAYLPYLRSKQQVVLIGSFKGARSITSASDPLYQALVTRHQRELFKLRTSLALMNSLNLPVVGVLYGMGDSKTTFANGIRSQLQERMNRSISAAGYGALVSNGSSKLTWGADELPAIAFAKQLPTYKAYVHASNPAALHIWDAMADTTTVLNEKLPSIGLTRVNTVAEADIEVYILNREPNIGSKILNADASPENCPTSLANVVCKNGKRVYSDDPRFADRAYTGNRPAFSADNTAQAQHDQQFMNLLASIPAARRAKAVIIDARVPNGAWNKVGAPTQTDWLTYSAWGTFANNIGLALAQAKVLHHARVANLPVNVPANSRRLLLEAVAHDVYANGYYEGQKDSLDTNHQSFSEKVSAAGISFLHQGGYTADQTYTVFSVLNQHVNNAMRAHFSLPTGTRVQVSAQFWRTFETEVHLYPVASGELLIPGLYRTGSVPGATKPMQEILSPLYGKASSDLVTPLTLDTLTGQASGVR